MQFEQYCTEEAVLEYNSSSCKDKKGVVFTHHWLWIVHTQKIVHRRVQEPELNLKHMNFNIVKFDRHSQLL